MRAQYRYSETLNIFVIAGLVSAGLVVAAWTMRGDATPFMLLLPVVGIPGAWWYSLVYAKYRMELTDTHLRLRSLMGAPVEIPLVELAEIGQSAGQNLIRVVRRDGRSWKVFAGEGLVEFADEVGRVAPNVEVRTSSMDRRMARFYRFFGSGSR